MRGILITGCPRSGTSLLYCMLRYSVHGFRFHDREETGIRDGEITKYPRAVFELDPDEDRAILMIRDPRAVLTSIHPAEKFRHRGYFVSAHHCLNDPKRGLCEYWKAIKLRPRAYRLRYEDLVDDPRRVQDELATRFGLQYQPGRYFDRFHAEPCGEYWETAMRGRRPIAPRDWQEHEERLREQFETYPELTDVLEEMGYASA